MRTGVNSGIPAIWFSPRAAEYSGLWSPAKKAFQEFHVVGQHIHTVEQHSENRRRRNTCRMVGGVSVCKEGETDDDEYYVK